MIIAPSAASATPEQTPRFYGGLDLGQAVDYTALAVVSRTEHPDPDHPERALGHYHCGYLQRFKLGTSYTSIVSTLKDLYAEKPLKGTDIAVDFTGTGRPVVDQIRASNITARVWPVTLTGGLTISAADGGAFNVPKRVLCSGLQLLFQSKRLKIAPELPEAKALVSELSTFTVRISIAGTDTYEAYRERDHDDMVLALAFACWIGELAKPYEAPSSAPDAMRQPFRWKRSPHTESPSKRIFGRSERR